jgi:hypothetical protein
VRFSIVGLVVFIAAYVASILLYIDSGMGHPHQIADSPPSGDGTTVTVDVEDIQSNNSVLRSNLTVSPGPELLDPVTHTLKDDLSVVVTSVVTAGKRTWPKGTLPDVFPVSLTLAGDVADWPFDRYRSGLITIELFPGAAQVPERPTVSLVDRLLGWKVGATRTSKPDGPAEYQLDLKRSPSTAAFGILILGVLIALAGLGLFVAGQDCA